VYRQPPFSAARIDAAVGSRSVPGSAQSVAVIVPTRDRPDQLERCLDALSAARGRIDFQVYVCDSSRTAASRVAGLCERHPFVDLIRHDRVGAAAARNIGTERCEADLVVTVDDDVYVEPGAIAELVETYRRGDGARVVAGSVGWKSWTSRPLMMRRIGFGRDARAGEEPEFIVSALVLYPRQLGLTCPWNERLRQYEDRFASLLWRAAGARLLFAADARATHDEAETVYPVADEADCFYANLFDVVFVSRSPLRLFYFEVLGFAARAKKWARSPLGACGLISAWVRGHVAFGRDYSLLRRTARAAREGAPGRARRGDQRG
jgi:glycosyltransferase involved in cell wall biosynthesis